MKSVTAATFFVGCIPLLITAYSTSGSTSCNEVYGTNYTDDYVSNNYTQVIQSLNASDILSGCIQSCFLYELNLSDCCGYINTTALQAHDMEHRSACVTPNDTVSCANEANQKGFDYCERGLINIQCFQQNAMQMVAQIVLPLILPLMQPFIQLPIEDQEDIISIHSILFIFTNTMLAIY